MNIYVKKVRDKCGALVRKYKGLKDKTNKIEMDVEHKTLSTLRLKYSKSILFKMVCVFLLLIIVPVVLIGVFSSNSITAYIENDAELKLLDTTVQTSRYFNLFTKSVEDATLQLALDQNISNRISEINNNKEDMFAKLDNVKQVEENLTSFALSNKYIKQLFIIDSSENVYSNDSNNKNINYKNSSWYEEVINGNKKTVWISNRESDSSTVNNGLSVVRIVNANSDGSKNNTILFDIDSKYFTDVLADIKVGKDDLSYIIIPSGKVLSGKGNQEETEIAESEFVNKIKEKAQISEKTIINVKYESKNYLAAYTKSNQNGWIFVTMIPEDEITAESHLLQIKIAILGIIFIIIALIIAAIFSLQITKRLNVIVKNMKMAEEGDLNIQLGDLGKDEIGILGNTFNSMIIKIKDLINQSKQLTTEVSSSCSNIFNVSNETTKASQEIAKTIGSISTGTLNQTKEIENSINTINELAKKIKFVVDSTRNIENSSKNVKQVTSLGITSLNELVKKTNETNKITKEVISEFDILNDYLRNINQVTTVLENIAQQTSLLSLNASIEAARAGEAGKGFGVVANEVKKLAEQSTSSTKDIQKLIEKISGQTNKTTILMNKTGLIVKEQVEAVTDSSNSFSKIDEESNILFSNINEITIAINNIDNDKNNVVENISNIAKVSEDTAAATQEMSACTEENTASVEELNNMIEQLDHLSNKLINDMKKFKV